MKKININIISVIVLSMLVAAQVSAEERIGDLVFEKMRQIDARQAAFLSDAKQIREERDKATKEKESSKRKFLQAREGTLEQKEAHAELTYSLAKIFKHTYDELNLVRSTSEDHLTTLITLKDGLKNGSMGVNERAAKKILKDTGSFLESSDKLLISIGQHADLISDPVIKKKLASASSTALLLRHYLANNQKTNSAALNTQQLLMAKVNELVGQMEEIYNQTDILVDLIRDRSTVLKLSNEIAAAELATIRLANGKAVITSLSKEVVGPLKAIISDSDSDLDLVTKGMLNTSMSNGQEDIDMSWTKGLKNRE